MLSGIHLVAGKQPSHMLMPYLLTNREVWVGGLDRLVTVGVVGRALCNVPPVRGKAFPTRTR